MRNLLFLAVLAAIAPLMNAQRAGSSFHGFARSAHSRAAYYPAAFSDPFYSDYLASVYPAGSQSPILFLQSPPAAEPFRFPSPAQPIMIELQGDRYVRLSGEENSGAEIIGPESIGRSVVRNRNVTEEKLVGQETGQKKFGQEGIEPASHRSERPSTAATQASSSQPLASAILVFRDGHHEEVSDYTIADGVLYTQGDFYTNGSWNRKIVLSSLNLSETVQLNHSRGITFHLPSAPNEVIIR